MFYLVLKELIEGEIMFDRFDKYLSGFESDDYAMDYWYDEGVEYAQKMLNHFNDRDWMALREACPSRTIGWKKRLAYCLHDGSSIVQFQLLLLLSETYDIELFELVVDSLREFRNGNFIELLRVTPNLVNRIEELLPNASFPIRKVFEEFIKLVSTK